ncbi:MAG: hypothetical protein JSV88_34050 [Candidatus Aminicenantes bacterium]|nr:MAG: hypothetical protein JSV88_34050 [Candidatus Aminicenantes bacterium]
MDVGMNFANALSKGEVKMNFDFELKLDKGYLRIGGPLGESDSIELKRILALSLEKSRCLVLDIDDVTTISIPCIEVLTHVYNQAKQRKWPLFLASRYQGNAMDYWISKMSTGAQEGTPMKLLKPQINLNAEIRW